MSEIHLAQRCKEAIVTRQKKSVVFFGVNPSTKFQMGERVAIFASKEPLAEGVVRSIWITNISGVIDHVLSGPSSKNVTKQGILSALNDYFLEKTGKRVNPKDKVTIVEWDYLDI